MKIMSTIKFYALCYILGLLARLAKNIYDRKINAEKEMEKASERMHDELKPARNCCNAPFAHTYPDYCWK